MTHRYRRRVDRCERDHARVRARERMMGVAIVLVLSSLGLHRAIAAPGDTVGRSLTRHMVAVGRGESLAVFASPPRDTVSRSTAALNASATTLRPTVVIIPGPIGSAFAMRHVTTALAQRQADVLVVDLLGMGAAGHPARADYSMAQQARRLSATFDSLRLGRVLLVAQGTSATVALLVASNEPHRVSAVLSLAGGPVDDQRTHGVNLALAMAPLLDNAVGRTLGRRRVLSVLREQSATVVWCTPEVLREYLRPYEQDLRGSLRALKGMSDAIEPARIVERLHTVSVPVHLLIGEKRSEGAPSDDQIRTMQHSLRAFEAETIAGAGTMLHEERPDAVVSAILALLRGGPTP